MQWSTASIGDPVSILGVNEQAALLTAIREQLGLRLQMSRTSPHVIVIDAVSPSTPVAERTAELPSTIRRPMAV
jgi:uncharacterized protein (TIGR03435 family)